MRRCSRSALALTVVFAAAAASACNNDDGKGAAAAERLAALRADPLARLTIPMATDVRRSTKKGGPTRFTQQYPIAVTQGIDYDGEPRVVATEILRQAREAGWVTSAACSDSYTIYGSKLIKGFAATFRATVIKPPHPLGKTVDASLTAAYPGEEGETPEPSTTDGKFSSPQTCLDT